MSGNRQNQAPQTSASNAASVSSNASLDTQQLRAPAEVDINKYVAQLNIVKDTYRQLLKLTRQFEQLERKGSITAPQREVYNGAKKLIAGVNGALKRSAGYVETAREGGVVERDSQIDAKDSNQVLSARNYLRKMKQQLA